MESISLELKLISCRHLKAFNFFQKPSVYAVVYLFNDEAKKSEKQEKFLQMQKTPVDREGGRNPEWNHAMMLDLELVSHLDLGGDHLFLKFELCCEGIMFGKRSIGQVCVPLKDLLDECNNTVRFVSYQVRNCDGTPSGVLNFSFKVNWKAKKNVIDPPKSKFSFRICSLPEKVSYPSLEDHQVQTRTSMYPSLEDIISPPMQTISMPLRLQSPAFAARYGVHNHQPPSPFATGQYWCTATETAGNGCSPRGFSESYATRDGLFGKF